MDIVAFLIDFILHVDVHLAAFVQTYGAWVYALLFLIIFVETGLVVMPFLPGDSLLFVVGALCGAGLMDLPLAIGLMLAAAILGDQRNYTIGRYFGPKVFQWEQSRWFNKRRLRRRRTPSTSSTAASPSSWRASCLSCAPSRPSWPVWRQMTRSKFTLYNVVGGAAVGGAASRWPATCSATCPGCSRTSSKIIWAMILIPGLIVIAGAWRARRAAAA